VLTSPSFGQADLTNCERELIHLAGSIQPHGVLLVLREPDLVVVQASANLVALLGIATDALLNRPLSVLGGNVDAVLRELAAGNELLEPAPVLCRVGHAQAGGVALCEMEGSAHRLPEGGLVVELEPLTLRAGESPAVAAVDIGHAFLLDSVSAALQRFSNASTIGTLADAVVKCVRDMTGYDRVMVYKFDPEGHGKIIAEARDPRLEPLLGHHYPASDIPQRARELYLRNRVRVLVDSNYVASPLVPALLPLTGRDTDMSLCYLRSMSPLHTQYLRNMGVTATLVVSLVRDGRLWGLIAAHHYSPRNLRYAVRAASALLAEVVSTRIAAIENYAHTQVAILVRRLEQRLVEATSTEGDWRMALFRNPHTLLQPLEATGAALFHDDEIQTSGEVPSTPELRALLQWVDSHHPSPLFSCSSVERSQPALASLTPVASGVLAVKLSTSRPNYLMWFRKEQLLTVTWAGDPSKPVIADDPLELSPRRSFAAWSEIVRRTALPWSDAEQALAHAIGAALVDIIVQVHAVRLLIAEHHLSQTRATVQSSNEPVVLADASGRLLLTNEAFTALVGPDVPALASLDDLPGLFTQPASVAQTFSELTSARQPWRGELALARTSGEPLPVSLRAEIVPGRGGELLGFILIVLDISDAKRAEAARQRLEQSLTQGNRLDFGGRGTRESDAVINAILANASVAAMDIAEGQSGASVAPLLEELEASTERAAMLYRQIRKIG
jgi:PAS domain S-box-containing protein